MLRARGGGCSGSKAKDGTDDEKRHDTWIQDLGDKPKKAYSAFVSHFKAEAAMEAKPNSMDSAVKPLGTIYRVCFFMMSVSVEYCWRDYR